MALRDGFLTRETSWKWMGTARVPTLAVRYSGISNEAWRKRSPKMRFT